MRRPLLPRSLALAGAAFSLLAAGTAASMTLFGDRAATHFNPSTSTTTQGTLSGHGASPALSNQQTHPAAQGGQLAAGTSTHVGELGATVQAGPSIFEQQVRLQQPSQQISAGPTIFEQQVRSQAPRPKSVPGPITRGPGPAPH